jgi:hypothetical protein
MNSELSVNVSFHAIIAKLTLFQLIHVSSHVQEIISLESGLELSVFEFEFSEVLEDSHSDLNSSICFRYVSLSHSKLLKRAKYNLYCSSSITISLNLKINREASRLETG